MTKAMTVSDLPFVWKKERSDVAWFTRAKSVGAVYMIAPYVTFSPRSRHYQLSWMYRSNSEENIWSYKTLNEAKDGAERHYLQRFSAHNPLPQGVVTVALTATGVALGLLLYELFQKARSA